MVSGVENCGDLWWVVVIFMDIYGDVWWFGILSSSKFYHFICLNPFYLVYNIYIYYKWLITSCHFSKCQMIITIRSSPLGNFFWKSLGGVTKQALFFCFQLLFSPVFLFFPFSVFFCFEHVVSMMWFASRNGTGPFALYFKFTVFCNLASPHLTPPYLTLKQGSFETRKGQERY